jgi:hypothetical protein
VKLVAERQPGVTTDIELACIERDAQAGLADLGLSLAEAKQLTAALQAEIVPAQVAALGECPRACLACGRRLASKGYSQARFRSPLGTSSPLFPQRWRKQRMRPLPRRDGLQLDGFRARHLARLASS